MFDSGKIKELERKILELEKLNEKCTLTNDIKISLIKYTESNEEFKKIIEKRVEEKQNIDKKKWWECSNCPIPIIIYILLVWFIFSNITDKIIEYKKTNITLPTIGLAPDAK